MPDSSSSISEKEVALIRSLFLSGFCPTCWHRCSASSFLLLLPPLLFSASYSAKSELALFWHTTLTCSLFLTLLFLYWLTSHPNWSYSQMKTLWSLDLLEVSSHKGVFVFLCHCSLGHLQFSAVQIKFGWLTDCDCDRTQFCSVQFILPLLSASPFL